MDYVEYQSYDDELAAHALDSDAPIMINTTDGAGVSFPAPQPAPLPPMITTAAPANDGNQKVLVGGLAVVLMVLAWVGLRSHGE